MRLWVLYRGGRYGPVWSVGGGGLSRGVRVWWAGVLLSRFGGKLGTWNESVRARAALKEVAVLIGKRGIGGDRH